MTAERAPVVIDAVDGKPSEIVTLREGLRNVEVSAAILESAGKGATITVGESSVNPKGALQ